MTSSIGRKIPGWYAQWPQKLWDIGQRTLEGVKTLYEEIISKYVDPIYSDWESQKIKAHLPNPRPVAEAEKLVKVEYRSIEPNIRDFDAALGYIFSVYPLPATPTTSNTYLPLLAVYCNFIQLMTDPLIGVGMNNTPTTACIVVGAPPNRGAAKALHHPVK